MTCPTGIGNLTIDTLGDRILDAFVCGIGTDTRVITAEVFASLLILLFVGTSIYLIFKALRNRK